MIIELVPVIEITNYYENIPTPSDGPSWKFPDEWENYFLLTNVEAGYSKDLKSYSKGSSLYQINEISDADLLKLIQKEINVQQSDENL
ncbi:hypothetical protein [Chryseobacterium balustinum]|uniref:Uncharacterized protein n=1 Tax=Chryseobacterium balustinum TaxID=246 RepID=A0AAX2IM77_9FLAO|nr:hypothetical protein [Chryseobacterium balustinum]AZB30211.1 hypothetical protein EB354_13640 [Chryseobacterium balustinum]SKB64082.1 hypothetical protein SAMN05421800_1057 [Chryseobacterium balustinum]SQA90839.1 Uncharacterised protein [Chryseobacterium balustinum]